MSLKVAVVRAAAITAGTTQDFTSAGFGTPVAAMFLFGRNTTDDNHLSHACYSVGFTDGTRQSVCAASSQKGVATSNTFHVGATDEVIQVMHVAAALIAGEANFDSWVTDGVRINWGVLPSNAFMITAILFGGSAVQAYSGTADTISGDSDITAPGFEPNLVFTIGNLITALNDTVTSDMLGCWGVCSNDGTTVVQRNVAFSSMDNKADAEANARLGTSYSQGYVHDDTAEPHAWDLKDFDSDGFTVGQVTTGLYGAYLALGFENQVWVGTVETPTSTGVITFTGPGWQPIFAGLIQTRCLAVDTLYTDGNAGAQGYGVTDGVTDGCFAWAEEDASATTDSQTDTAARLAHIPEDDGGTANDHKATLDSFASTGPAVNFTETDTGNARQWILFAVRAPIPPFGGPTGMSNLALPKTFRFYAKNDAGETLDAGDIDLFIEYQKASRFQQSARVYTQHGPRWSDEITYTNGAQITDTNYGAASATVDNSSDKYIGFTGYVSVVVGAPAGDGEVSIWLQASPDGGTDWPDDGEGWLLTTIDVSGGAATYKRQIAF
jgi:hypothetical protein